MNRAHPKSDGSAARAFDASLEAPEMRLLIACCRQAAGVAAPGEIGVALAQPWDPELFVAACHRHQLTLVAYRYLVRPHRDALPAGLVSLFETRFRNQLRNQTLLGRASLAIHEALAAAGVRHAFLKGAVLRKQLFGGELLRQSGDIDVLLAKRDVARADAALAATGFHRKVSRARARLRLPPSWSYRKDAAYEGPRGERLELHWRTDLLETLWDDFADAPLAGVEFEGRALPVLDDALNATYLCLHGAKHHWSQFRWVLDIPMLLQARGLEPSALIAAAEARGLGLAAREALHLAEKLFGIPAPAEARLSAREAERLARRHLLVLHGAGKLDTLRLIAGRSRLYPGVGRKLKFFSILTADQVLLFLGSRPEAVRIEGST